MSEHLPRHETPPTPGWYWTRFAAADLIGPIVVRVNVDLPIERAYPVEFLDEIYPVTDFDGFWGPLEPPAELVADFERDGLASEEGETP